MKFLFVLKKFENNMKILKIKFLNFEKILINVN